MDQPEVFNFESNEVRTVLVDDEPYFVGKDIADVLGYVNTRDALSKHVDLEDKHRVAIRDTMGRSQNVVAINESGLYSLIISSKLPNAKAFKRWVTKEVLPSIRRHGMYAKDELVNNPELFLEVLENYKTEKEKNKMLATVLKETQPIISYYNEILQSNETLTITQIAADYGMSGQAMNQLLKRLRVQRKVNNQWVLFSYLVKKGLTRSETKRVQNGNKTVVTTRWTQKGRLFLYNTLKKEGIYPIIDDQKENSY
ncbi:phage antirepressor [uncultured Enterococcus sp.]|uniref:phage antirepressor n=1 Tax=uncultured Enterococcus sp. TaxID=167972 RepID=UPI0028F0C21F|nr:phage antirepressor [uncultured Enterococcus sp.]